MPFWIKSSPETDLFSFLGTQYGDASLSQGHLHMLQDLVLFAQLIPCRYLQKPLIMCQLTVIFLRMGMNVFMLNCFILLIRSNNSIVDAVFEEHMERLSLAEGFGNWEAFAHYLKTHPANPEQWHTDAQDISW